MTKEDSEVTMRAKENDICGLMICHLCNIKNGILGGEGAGYIASAGYIDKAINTILHQQTDIADLQCQLEIEKKYASAWGDFYGYTPQELTEEEQDELRKHMNILEEKWKKRQEDSE